MKAHNRIIDCRLDSLCLKRQLLLLFLLLRAINQGMQMFQGDIRVVLPCLPMASNLSDQALRDSLAVRLGSIRSSRYWMNVTDIGAQALADVLRAATKMMKFDLSLNLTNVTDTGA